VEAQVTAFLIINLTVHLGDWLWCKREDGGDDEEMQRFVPIEDLFKGRHFDRQIIILCVSWYASQYLNNLVEQDHRRVKQRIRPMLGFKRFDNAVVTISGIELAEKIKKGQFKTGKLGGCDATMTELWNAALAA